MTSPVPQTPSDAERSLVRWTAVIYALARV